VLCQAANGCAVSAGGAVAVAGMVAEGRGGGTDTLLSTALVPAGSDTIGAPVLQRQGPVIPWILLDRVQQDPVVVGSGLDDDMLTFARALVNSALSGERPAVVTVDDSLEAYRIAIAKRAIAEISYLRDTDLEPLLHTEGREAYVNDSVIDTLVNVFGNALMGVEPEKHYPVVMSSRLFPFIKSAQPLYRIKHFLDYR
jgi:hypothetical protein